MSYVTVRFRILSSNVKLVTCSIFLTASVWGSVNIVNVHRCLLLCRMPTPPNTQYNVQVSNWFSTERICRFPITQLSKENQKNHVNSDCLFAIFETYADRRYGWQFGQKIQIDFNLACPCWLLISLLLQTCFQECHRNTKNVRNIDQFFR